LCNPKSAAEPPDSTADGRLDADRARNGRSETVTSRVVA
jgi:hypothetical protein